MNVELKNPFRNARVVSYNTDPAEYHRCECGRGNPKFVLSRSSLLEFYRCPARWHAGYQQDDTASLRWGSLIDALVLGGAGRFTIRPATYTSAAGEEKPWNSRSKTCRAWLDEHADTEVVPAEEFRAAKDAVQCLTDDPEISSLLSVSRKQVLVCAEYHDADTELVVPIRGLIDLVPPFTAPTWGTLLADLKTCACAAPDYWARHVRKFGYHVQGAMYLWLWNAATGESRDTFLHVVQENYPPYHVRKPLPILSQSYLELGQAIVVDALRQYCACLRSGEWPGYPTTNLVYQGFEIIEPPFKP